MKRKIFKSLITFTLALITFIFSGCIFLAQPKTFTKAGVSITLTNAFVEKEYVTMTCYYESPQLVVTLLKEEFTMLSGLEDWTLMEYAETTIKGNKLTDSVAAMSEDGYAYFEYQKELSGNNYSYYATCHKTGDAFWLIQFGCLSKNFDNLYESILKYAKSITFDSSTDVPSANV